jgi:hypothetical protein
MDRTTPPSILTIFVTDQYGPFLFSKELKWPGLRSVRSPHRGKNPLGAELL